MGFNVNDSVRLTQAVYDSASGKEFPRGTYAVVTRVQFDDVWLQVTVEDWGESKTIQIKATKWDIS
jgi:hypothetical protein